jgi:hypothetical protein
MPPVEWFIARDLARKPRRRHTRRSSATRIEEFASRYVRHTIGKWAGKPFQFLPQVVRTLFNTLDEHGRRQIRTARPPR